MMEVSGEGNAMNEPLTEREKMLACQLYQSWGDELVQMRAACRDKFLKEYNNVEGLSYLAAAKIREELLKKYMHSTGEKCFIEPPFFCDYGCHVSLGDRVYMNFGTVILDCNYVKIGSDVKFGANVQVLCAGHPIDPEVRKTGLEYGYPVTIGDNVWVGSGALLIANRPEGLHIGDGCCIAAGSVVVRDVPEYTIVGGNPARVIRSIEH